jgi:hypothetical protein
MSDSVLIAGPWIGEFGYELFRWQGHLRRISKSYDRTIVASRPGHELLYQDFAEFIPVDSNPNPCDGVHNAIDKDPMVGMREAFGHIEDAVAVHPCTQFRDDQPADYVKLGGGSKAVPFDIVFHARSIVADPTDMSPGHTGQKINRNWSEEQWIELAEWFGNFGYEMACIGDPRASLRLPGCADRRGLPLTELADLLSASGWLMGPSSGPVHFASLCGCQQFVWGTKNLKARYKTIWNPFDTFVHHEVCDASWNPAVADITHAFTRLHE